MRKTPLFSWCRGAALLSLLLGGSLYAQLSDITQPGDPIVATSNNSPGSEGVANAIDDQPTKYLNFDRLNTGFTVSPRVGLSVVQCLTLTSANDAPERDPASYTLEGSYDGTNFTLISSGPVPAFAARFDKVVIRIENNTPFLVYRVIFPTVVGPGGNSMQIAEVELLGFLAPTDVTQPGDPIVATSNNSPGSEGVANAIDDQPTKYLNFDRVNTGFTVTPSVGATLVSGITLTSANDAPDRDPATYTLEGSLDGVSFHPIASGSVPAFPTRFYKNYIFFPNSRAYTAYRLIFPVTAGPSTCCMQIAEVELLGVVSDLPQDVTQPGDPIIASSNNSPGSEGVANAIDNAPTKYLNFDRLNTGFTVSPRAGLTIVNGLTLTSANDAPERDPADFTLAGSYDGSNFTAIASGPVPAFATRFAKNTILFENKIPYLHYRLIFPNVVGPGGNSMQISEVELLGVLAPSDVTVPGDPIVATSNNSPGSEGVANAIDDQPTKYLNFDRVNTGFTVTPGVGDTIVSGITLTSANDAPDRDPATYELSGSNDGMEFVPISSGTVPLFPTRFYKNYIFFPQNTKSFKSYRLIFPVTAGPSTCCMQIAEVEFLGVTPGVVNTNPVDTLIRRQPQDTPVLLGQPATFRILLTGPWKVQWYRNDVRIPGATSPTYMTPPTTAADDGALFHAVVQSPQGIQVSDKAMLSIFTPSAVESIGLSWEGEGANGAPTPMFPTDITGFHPQAYWNNLTTSAGTLTNPLNSSNQPSVVTVAWAASGEWGVGTGEDDPTQRMLNGMATSFSTTEASAQSVTFTGVPAGSHTLFLYTVQVPQEFFNMDFIVEAGGMVQRRYIRPQNADEYNPAPGFSLVTADTAAARGVGNMMRFDNLQPGPDGMITIRFYSPGRVDLPGGDPIRGPGLNGLQLVLNAPPAVQPPVITRQPASANGLAGGCITLSVDATGPNLSYQWLKNGQEIAGATDAQLTLNNLSTNSAGNYTVIVSNPAGRVSSQVAVVGVVGSAQVTLGLITHFKFDEEDLSTPVVVNSAPGGQNGDVRGAFPTTTPGQIANALIFDNSAGFENHVFVPNYPKVSRAITVAGWVNSATEQWGPIINNWIEGRTTGQSGQFLVEVVPVEGVPMLRAQIEVGPNRALATAAIDGSLNTWHHFAVSANGNTLSIYWDGRLVGTADYLGTINVTPSIPWLAIGANFNGDTPPAVIPPTFGGQMDDLAIWNRSLSGVEIQGIYSAGLSGMSVSQVPPILTVGACPPTITCPPNITAQCVDVLTPVTWTVTAVDTSGAPVPVVCVPPSGTGFRVGQSNVVCTATDAMNASASCTFRVVVVDTTPPTITCSTNITANASGPNGAVVTYIASAADPCGIATFNCAPPPGSTFPLGVSTVTCVAVDAADNTNSCSFTITVIEGTVNRPPVCVANVSCSFRVPNDPRTYVIAPNGAACVTLDGSASSDPDNDPLSFKWILGNEFSVSLDPSQEPGGTGGTGSGTGTVTLSGNTLTINLSFSGLSANASAAHIHGPAPFGTNASVLYGLNSLTTLGATAGTISGTVTLAEGTGGFTIAQQLQQLRNGLWYVNIHTPNHPGGEIRGQILAPTLSGAVANNCFDVGCHAVLLQVSDGQSVSTCVTELCVISAAAAVEECVMLVDNANLGRRNKRPLVASLKAAAASFERGDSVPAINQLEAFQNKVAAQLAKDFPAQAEAFIECAQRIIDAVDCE